MNNKIKIIVVTGTRAEYGLLKRLINLIDHDEKFILNIIVTGSHLSEKHGNTYKEIEQDGYINNYKINIGIDNDLPEDISKSTASAINGFSEAYKNINPDLVIILGDRYELLGAAISAMFYKIPIAHIHGGELTYGAIDDLIRHSLTKMSHIHFVATEEYKKRVIQLGENPKYVYNVGGLGVDAIQNIQLLNKNQIEFELGIPISEKLFIITYHPVTIENNEEYEVAQLLKAISDFSEYQIIFTMPNADQNNKVITKLIKEYIKNRKNSYLFSSLGQLKYLSCVALSNVVIGNSSSGILEVPSFKIPTVNIGSRQSGRVKSASIIDCKAEYTSIFNSIKKALSSDFKKDIKKMKNLYEKKDTSNSIYKILKNVALKEIIQKKFQDL